MTSFYRTVICFFIFLSFNISSVFAIEDKNNTDIQVLSAQLGSSISPKTSYNTSQASIPIPIRQCNLDFKQQKVDCTRLLTDILNAEVVNPVAGRLAQNGRGEITSPDMYGSLVEIYLVIKEAAFSATTFQGIGFYTEQNHSGAIFSFLPKETSKLPRLKKVILQENNTPAFIIKVYAYMGFSAGMSATSWTMGKISFKPFAQFFVDPNIYRNWDHVSTNYILSRTTMWGGVTGFDRSKELLKD
ncbi:MAG: hypothetical protein HY843_05165 [Bdellovibrio sp.]|nr:hypothetical protein [Bdellovibrio sp.]